MIDRMEMARRIAAGQLSSKEEKLLAKANVWIMDVEMDGGTLPPEVERISSLRRRLNPDEARVLIDFFYRTAPGNY